MGLFIMDVVAIFLASGAVLLGSSQPFLMAARWMVPRLWWGELSILMLQSLEELGRPFLLGHSVETVRPELSLIFQDC